MSYDEPLHVSYPRLREIPARLTVKGERPLGNYKWSRFNQSFNLPENCDAKGMKSNFENGVFTVTIPQKVIAPDEKAKSTQDKEEIAQNQLLVLKIRKKGSFQVQ